MADQMITVGGRSARAEILREYVGDYLSGNEKWAYPAYDSYLGYPDPRVVGDADLLAVSLLNAGQKPLPTFYTFRRLLEPINERFKNPVPVGQLEDAGEVTLEAIADLFGVLDECSPTPQVGKTKLSKVLHRKLPDLIPLFDRNVFRTYSEGDNAPLPKDRTRSHRDYFRAWLPLVQDDLKRHQDFWDEVVGMALLNTPISRLRALDIVAWKLGSK